MGAEADVLRFEPQTCGDFRLRRRLSPQPLGQPRQLEIGGKRLALAMAGAADDVADPFLEHDPEVLRDEQVAALADGR